MKHKSINKKLDHLSYKQFAKDCKNCLSQDVLKHGHLKSVNSQTFSLKSKTTVNSKIPNKF